MRLPMVLYGPSFDAEQEAVLRTQAASRCGVSPYDFSASLPSVVAIPDSRFVDAIRPAVCARTEVLPPGDARRAPHALSYGEHAALLQLELRLQDLDIPPELWGNEVSSVVRSVFERSATVLWQEFLRYNPSLRREIDDLRPYDRPCVLGKRLLADPSRGVLTRALVKDQMNAEGDAHGSRREIEDFVYRIRDSFVFSLDDVLLRDVLRLESLREDSFDDMDPSMKQRIGHVEVQRVSVERNVPRELFVRLVQEIISALGYPELEVGVLSVTQALTKNCSSLLVFPRFQSGPVQLFLPISVYGTPCRLLTMYEFFQLLGANLMICSRHFNKGRGFGDMLLPYSPCDLENELAQLEFLFHVEGDTHDVSVSNPSKKGEPLDATDQPLFCSRSDFKQPLDVFMGLHREEVLRQTG